MDPDKIIKKAIKTINSYSTLSNLKKAIINNEYTSSSSNFTRLLVWKTILITGTLNIKEWEAVLQLKRNIWFTYEDEFYIPFDLLDSDNAYYLDTNADQGRDKSHKNNLRKVNVTSDPLSNDYQTDQDLDILRIIIMDIERLFPGEEQLINEDFGLKQNLVRILYIWNKLNRGIGYKQGMHEILGLIYYNLYNESYNKTMNKSSNEYVTNTVISLYDMDFLVNDVFYIFNNLMVNLSINYYEEMNLIGHFDKFNKLLIKIDQDMFNYVVGKLKLETSLWIIRYFKLLLIRELGVDSSIKLWDKLICLDNWEMNLFEMLPFLIIMLLINIKQKLIVNEFDENLYLLLHYPEDIIKGEFVSDLFKYSHKLYLVRNDDKELYKLGIKINSKINGNLVTNNQNKTNFDKLRLELRLKKKVSSMLK